METSQYTILIIEDSSEGHASIRRILEQNPTQRYHLIEAQCGADGLQLWREWQPDCVVVDYHLPDMDGLEVLAALGGEDGCALPVVLVTARADMAVAVEALRCGAQDYLAKEQSTPTDLWHMVGKVIEKRRRWAERQRAAAALYANIERYRAFIAHSLDGIWCIEIEPPIAPEQPADEQVALLCKHAYLAECNAAFARIYGYDQAKALVGARLTTLLPQADVRNIAYLRAFIAADYCLTDREAVAFDLTGQMRHFASSLTGIIENGTLRCAWGVQRDITQQRQSAIRRQFLLELSVELAQIADPEDMVSTAVNRLGQQLGVSHVGLNEVDWTAQKVVVHRSSYFNQPPGDQLRFRLDLFASMLDEVRMGRTIIVHDTAIDARTTCQYDALYQPLHIGAFVIVPLLRAGKWATFLLVDSATPRNWTADEVTFVQEVAGLVWPIYEKACAEQSFRELTEQLELSLQCANLGTWFYNISTGAFIADDRTRSLYGFAAEDSTETLLLANTTMHPDDRPVMEANFQEVVATQGTYDVQYRVMWPDGSTHWIASLGSVDASGAYLRGIVQDITARKQAESILERYHLLSEHARDIVLFVRLDGQIIEANDAALAAYGYDRPTLLTKNIYHLRDPETAPLVVPQMAQANQNGILFETIHLRKDGSRFPVEVSSVGTDIGGERLLLSIIRDITERKRAEAILQQQVALIQLSYEPIFVRNLDGGIVQWNTGCERLYGYMQAEAIGQQSHQLLKTRYPLPLDVFLVLLERERRWTGELQQTTSDGRVVIVESRQELIEIEGQPLVLETNHDITAHKRAAAASTLLASASSVLAAIHDEEAMLTDVASLIVPGFADWCMLYLVAEDGTIRPGGNVCTNLEQAALLHELQASYLSDPAWEDSEVMRAIQTRAARLVAEVTDDWTERVAADPHHQQLFRALAPRSLIAAPLLARGRLFGALTCAASESGRRYDKDDLDLAQELARRIALALDNVRLYAAEQAARSKAEQAAARIARLQAVTAGLSRATTLQQVADVVVAHAMVNLGAISGSVQLLGQDGYTLDTLSSSNGVQKAQATSQIALDASSPVTVVARSGMPLFYESRAALAGDYPDIATHAALLGYEALAVAPLTIEARTVGALTLVFSMTRFFDAEERHFILALAGFSAQALERAHLYEAAQRARAVAEENTRRVAQLQAVTAALAAALTPEHVSQITIDQGLAALGAHAGSVVLLDPESQMLRVMASVGYPVDVLERWKTFALDAHLPIADAVRTGQSIWIESRAAHAARYPHLAGGVTINRDNAWAAIPLTANGRTLGALGLSFAEPHAFAEDEQSFVLSVAQQCAQALERAHLYVAVQQTRARLAFLSDASAAIASSLDYYATFRTLVTLIVPGLADWCVICELTPEAQIARIAQAHIEPEGEALLHELERFPLRLDQNLPISNVLRGGTAEIIESPTDMLQIQSTLDPPYAQILGALAPESFMVVPICARERVLGAISLVYSTSKRRYTREDLVLAEELGRRAGSAIDNARLYRDAMRAEARMRTLVDMSRVFAGAGLDLPLVLERIAQSIVDHLGDLCVIWLLSTDQRWLDPVACTHRDPEARHFFRELIAGTPIRSDEGLVGQVIMTGEARFTPVIDLAKVRTVAIRKSLPYIDRYGVTSQIIVPLRVRGMLLGAIAATRDQGAQPYTSEDFALIQELADRAALALDNAQLYTAERQSRAVSETAMRARDQFLQVASHELKTPLTSLMGNAQLIERRMIREQTLKERDQRTLRTIVEQGGRLNRMINALLDITDLEAGDVSIAYRLLDLAGLVRRIVNAARPALMWHTLNLESADELLVEGDEVRLEQVFQNLLDNAIKYSPTGGRIVVQIERQSELACVSITDEGIGIPVMDLPHLFERFYRASNVDIYRISGSGIGLFVVREIVGLHGGEVAVASVEGHGSTFTVYLPCLRHA